MKRLNKLKLMYIKHKYNKMMDEKYKRDKDIEKAINDFLIEEIDRRLERSQWLVDTYSKVFKKD